MGIVIIFRGFENTVGNAHKTTGANHTRQGIAGRGVTAAGTHPRDPQTGTMVGVWPEGGGGAGWRGAPGKIRTAVTVYQ